MMVDISDLLYPRILANRLSADDALNIAYAFLNKGARNNDAAVLFFLLAGAYSNENIFQLNERLFYRKAVSKSIFQWLTQDFDRNKDLTSLALGQFCAAFAKLEERPLEFFRKYLEEKILINSEDLSVYDSMNILLYFSNLGMSMAPVLFDAVCKSIMDQFHSLSPAKLAIFVDRVMMIDSINRTTNYQEYSPAKIYDFISREIDIPKMMNDGLKPYYVGRLERAEFWFKGKISESTYPYRKNSSIKPREILFPCLESKGIELVKCFYDAGSPLSALGIDGVYIVGDNVKIGCMQDTRSSYALNMGDIGVYFPKGKAIFNSAALERIMPDDIILRLHSLVLKNMNEEDMTKTITRLSLNRPGVYSVDFQGNIIPFRELVVNISQQKSSPYSSVAIPH